MLALSTAFMAPGLDGVDSGVADTVIIAGDISWAMNLEEAKPDFEFINNLPGNKIIIKDSNISISSALINGEYPKYNAVLPKEEMYTICVDSNKLQDALNLMAPVLNEEMIINLKITEENINLSANSKGNEGSTNVELCSNKNNINKDEEINIKFNAQYLLDALKNEDNELIISTYKDSIGIMFSFYDVKHFIMPISKR